MTQVEQYVRDRVRATGMPCLISPAGCAPSLRAVLLSDVGLSDEPGLYALVTPTADDVDLPWRWARATLSALTTVRKWVPDPPEGVEYVYEEGATDVVQRVDATVLGLSLLQIAFNRAGAGLAIEVVTAWNS